ncbi:MAG: iron-sulfur cluster assembly protein [Candidatus Tokpelaia sp. JSC161]|nr:MAG: iron-sulfur cluster assembly protein [Candidatus Tokpelaia sp. JSC161]
MSASVLTLTEKAAARVRELMQENENAYGLIVGLKKGGCAGMEYTVHLVREDMPGLDFVEKDGGRVFIAPEAVLFLLGSEMDFEKTLLRTGFLFRNPNQISACGCGESVAIRPVSRDSTREC